MFTADKMTMTFECSQLNQTKLHSSLTEASVVGMLTFPRNNFCVSRVENLTCVDHIVIIGSKAQLEPLLDQLGIIGSKA